MNKAYAKLVLSAGIAISMAIGFGAISTSAQAQSISCANAETPSEFAVCNNENLLIKDLKLASLYENALQKAGNGNLITRISAEHSLWLRNRNECKIDFTCLDKRYEERIERLQSTL